MTKRDCVIPFFTMKEVNIWFKIPLNTNFSVKIKFWGKKKLQLDTKKPLKNLSNHPFREF